VQWHNFSLQILPSDSLLGLVYKVYAQHFLKLAVICCFLSIRWWGGMCLPVWGCLLYYHENNIHRYCRSSMTDDHRIIAWPGLKRTTKIIEFQPPCYVQGRQSPDQAAQSHIQPGLDECLGCNRSLIPKGQQGCVVALQFLKPKLFATNINWNASLAYSWPVVCVWAVFFGTLKGTSTCTCCLICFAIWEIQKSKGWLSTG